MKVALIQCPVWGTYDPPVALLQLSGSLRRAGHEVSVFDLNIKLYRERSESYKNMWAWEQSSFWYDEESVNGFFEDNKPVIDEYIKKILATGARVIGFSVTASSRLASLKIVRLLKDYDNGLTVVFGGPLFFEENFVNLILREEGVDTVIRGEGEFVFVDLLRSMETRQNKQRVYSGSSSLPPSLDTLPFMDFTDLSLSEYEDNKHIVFMASRGCVQKCVFCSSRAFWPGYRAMSGERIFREIEFHMENLRKTNPDLSHVDFLDLAFNGNMKSLAGFCDLVIKNGLKIYWAANMIVRPEMDSRVIKKMYASGCEHVIFGIESGSQAVLDLMRKRYRIEDADRIIRSLYEAGIKVTANFMFGFPGETQDDFRLTLDFLKRNHRYLNRAYPSRTFCAIEEHSYLSTHLEEFNINPDMPNHLYWESADGRNIYPERLRRCEEFCSLASSLGIEVGSGVQTSVELDRFFNLGYYYEHKKDFAKALEYFLNYHRLDSNNETVLNKIKYYTKGPGAVSSGVSTES